MIYQVYRISDGRHPQLVPARDRVPGGRERRVPGAAGRAAPGGPVGPFPAGADSGKNITGTVSPVTATWSASERSALRRVESAPFQAAYSKAHRRRPARPGHSAPGPFRRYRWPKFKFRPLSLCRLVQQLEPALPPNC